MNDKQYLKIFMALCDDDKNAVELATLLHNAPESSRCSVIKSYGTTALRWAVLGQQKEIVRVLLQQPAELCDEMLRADNCHVFHIAAINKRLQECALLLEKSSQSLCDEMLRVMVHHWQPEVSAVILEMMDPQLLYDFFHNCAMNGEADTLRGLLQHLPEAMGQQLIAAPGFGAFLAAAENTHTEVLQLLLENVSDENRSQMLAAGHFAAFRLAAWLGETPIVSMLLDYAGDAKDEMLGCDNFEAFRAAAEAGHQHTLNFLLSQTSAEMRRQIEIVLENQPVIQPRADLSQKNLRAISQDAESAMIDLSPIHQAQFQQARDYYAPYIDTPEKQKSVIDEFRETLGKRYYKNPATFQTGDGRHEQILPLDWDEFERYQQQFSADTRENMLKAYYAHDAHTAYRYLLEDNKWLSPGAAFCIRAENGQKHSLFTQFIEPLAIAYLAIIDPTLKGPENATPEQRLDIFIAQMADLGRAHNRDTTRRHDYDDMEADKPSCSLGTMSRIVTGVYDHPFFIPLEARITALVKEKVKQHFEAKITEHNAPELLTAWESCIVMPTPEAIATLKQLDISPQEYNKYHADIMQELRSQLKDYPALLDYINSEEAEQQLRKNLSLHPHIEAYALQFASAMSLDKMLEKKAQTENAIVHPAILPGRAAANQPRASVLREQRLRRFAQGGGTNSTGF